MNDRFLFRAFYEGRFIYKNLIDANYYTYDNKCIGLANTLPNSLKWEQCTGLKDKNGKLIYEGDIISRNGMFRKVFWLDDEGGFGYEPGTLFEPLQTKTCEIVGNIHENPEFLEQSK